MLNRIRSWLGRGNKGLRGTPPHLATIAAHQRYQGEPAFAAGYNAVYARSPWVYVAISRIAEAAALVPLRVLRVQGDKRLQVIHHPLERLLDHPNPFQSRFELFEQTIGYLELTGNAYWYLVGDGRGLPAEIWVLRPDRVSIVPDAQQLVRGYLYELDGQRIALDRVEVIHFRRWHPGSDYYGLSALEAGKAAIEADRAMARWNQATFGEGHGVPAGIVQIRETISDSDYERLRREWRESYGSGQRRTAFLRGSGIEWQHIGLSHTDLDFLQGRQAHRDEILSIFGIPVGLVSENATEANASVAERQFIERTLYPKLVRIAQKITCDLLPFYPGEHVAEFDDIRPTDIHARLAEIETARNILTLNEIRARYYDLPPI